MEEREEVIRTLDGEIEDMQEIVNNIPEGNPLKAKAFSGLGSLFKEKFYITDHESDIDNAITNALKAVAATEDRHNRRTFLNDLGIYYREKFLISDDLPDIDKAVNYLREVIDTYSREDLIPARVFNSLGTAIGDRYLKDGKDADIDEAIEHIRNAISATPAHDPDEARLLNDLASLHGDRFSNKGEKPDLDEAVQNAHRAIQLTPDDHPMYATRSNNLATLLRDRHRIDSKEGDLDAAAGFAQHAVRANTHNKSERAIYLSNLANILGERSVRRDSQAADFDPAIEYAQESVDMTEKGHPDRPRRLSNLGELLRRKALKLPTEAAKSCLERAIDATFCAVKATKTDDQDYAARVNNLGLLFGDAYRCNGRSDDLDKAIQYSKEAIDGTDDDNPDLATYYSNLGSLFHHRCELHGQARQEDLRNAMSAYESCLGTSSGFPLTRVLAGQTAVYHLAAEKNWIKAAQLLDQILDLLPMITQPTSARDDLQHTLRQLFGLASVTGSVFLKAGRSPAKALQALEQSRGIISSLMMDFRADLSSLDGEHDDKRSRYIKVRQQITTANRFRDSSFLETSPRDYMTHDENIRRLFKDLSDIQNEIRQCRGFGNFLLPPSEKEISDLARDGPLVSFNVSDFSSEAFLVTTHGVQVVELPDLRKTNARRVIDACASRGNVARRDGLLSIGGKKQEQHLVSDAPTELSTLWRVAVKPVLSKLGLLTAVSTEKLPHIWWVGGGIMAQAPIHAAGDHSKGSTENTLSHVVSSYVTTLKTLQLIRKRPPTWRGKLKPKVLVISMPNTPDHNVTLSVADEAEAIEKHTGAWACTTVLEQPTKKEVLDEFETCTVAHFACHGIADSVEPAKSALLLGREKQERLALGDLDTVIHDGVELAYLSACSTAELKVEDLVDESIHLASSFQLSGFRHVIGTLWGADDAAAVAIAGKFYAELAREMDSEGFSVSHALHRAVTDFRGRQENCAAAWKWAPFIHMGC
ncbi:hypothetical protein Z517_09888 [Fonsecaea pedrosoi CBS 271.37]|uniref:CHAT domain-containing protein n=1 Tax=Fonsecaea pedrosoi CBS 271.37 TaxID=1442368 RepID=A0A0D2ET86_9EURO|nr:uncharacterized protein Z517_09888 [Fonsecaea pedrosoi CBS 271.37]KIW77442.1 hypothetical protein Z517_09888 [Fonsecaea pedrosoi CBS 271.37]